MSLAAVPVFLLARRLGLSAPGRAGPRGLRRARPRPALRLVRLVRGARVPAGPCLGVRGERALAQPTRRAQVAFVASRPGDPRPRPVRRPADRVRPGDRSSSGLQRAARSKEALREQLLPLARLRPGRRGRARVRAGARASAYYRWLLRLPRGPARHPPLGRARRDDACVRGRLDHRPGCAARPLADARPSPSTGSSSRSRS